MILTQTSRRRLLPQLLVLFTMLLANVQALAAGTEALTASEAQERAAAGELMLIDVRTPPEWRATGVAPLAKHLDLRASASPEAFARKVLALTGGERDTPIALICRTGNRSGHAQRALLDHGFSAVYNVSEGMVGSAAGPGWIARGLPLVPCPDC